MFLVQFPKVQGLGDLEIRGRVETIQTTAFLWSARILRRVLETWGCLSDSSEKTSTNTSVKKTVKITREDLDMATKGQP